MANEICVLRNREETKCERKEYMRFWRGFFYNYLALKGLRICLELKVSGKMELESHWAAPILGIWRKER